MAANVLVYTVILTIRNMNAKEFYRSYEFSGEEPKNERLIPICPSDIIELMEKYYEHKLNHGVSHHVSNSLDLVELEKKIDKALDSETSESLKEWLHSKRL